MLDDCYTFNMYDSFGDGWNGSTYTITDNNTGTVFGTGGLISGSFGSDLVSIGTACPVYGCTDSTAINYDPLADTDDGSCIYPLPCNGETFCDDFESGDFATGNWIVTAGTEAEVYIHSANVLHRDLKPSNLLVNSNCDLAICDFGLARGVVDDETLTEYVVTRWYRAPELLTEAQYYGPAVDVWSVGCILAELLGRRPLFQGKDYMHQLQVIINVLGTPNDESLAFVTNSMAKKAIKELPNRPKQSFQEIFSDSNPSAVDLLERMLVFDPRERCTVKEALKHPYFKALHDANEEPESTEKFQIGLEKKYRDTEIPRDILQNEIYNDMLILHPEEQGIERSGFSSSSSSNNNNVRRRNSRK